MKPPLRQSPSALAQRLSESEATVQALLAGQIDAVLDTSTGTPVLLAKSQAALRRSEEQLQAQAIIAREAADRTQYALTAARMGIVELDLVADRFSWSPTTAALHGLRPDQAPTTREAYLSLIHREDRQSVESAIARTIADGQDHSTDFRVVWPDGSAHWMSGRGRVIRSADGTPLRIVGVTMDISEVRTLQAQLSQSQKMEAIGQLAGGIAHDFNNLLTVILSYSELLIPSLAPSDVRRDDLMEIRRAAEAAAAMTRQLLAFSRQESADPKVLAMDAVIAAGGKMLHRLIRENVTLVMSLAPDTGRVRCVASQMEQVLMNLAVNAQQAMPRGGSLTISTENVTLVEDDSSQFLPLAAGRYVALRVTDTGQGMDDATKSHIFEPFFTTKGVGEGTGLGLATVYGIVKQSHGGILVESAVGSGTTFSVLLPRVDDALHATVVAERVPRVGTGTVLLVEDDPAVRQIMLRTLQHYGYQVLEASDGAAARVIALEHQGPIELLMTDVIMPGVGGREVAEMVRGLRPETKVLFVSGYTDDAGLRTWVAATKLDFLDKPFTPDALIRKVQAVLASQPVPLAAAVQTEAGSDRQRVMDQMSVVAYSLDASDCIVGVNEAWVASAELNDGEAVLPPGIIGRSLWECIVDSPTKAVYRGLLARVRERGEPVRFEFRCDTPVRRRLLEMRIAWTPSAAGPVMSFTTRPVRVESRASMALLDTGTPRSSEVLVMCGWCKRISDGRGNWEEVEVAVERLQLFGRPILPAISHGMCEDCRHTMTALMAGDTPPGTEATLGAWTASTVTP